MHSHERGGRPHRSTVYGAPLPWSMGEAETPLASGRCRRSPQEARVGRADAGRSSTARLRRSASSSVADVQLAAIAEHAGMRANHVLYYFGTRDEVLIAAAQQVELTLADGRAESLAAVADRDDRLRAYVRTYLPEDRHDPIWKLWLEGWLRSASHEGFAKVGDAAYAGWLDDLVETVQHAIDNGGSLSEPAAAVRPAHDLRSRRPGRARDGRTHRSRRGRPARVDDVAARVAPRRCLTNPAAPAEFESNSGIGSGRASCSVSS